MEVQLETPGGLARHLHVRIPSERVERAVDERIKRLASRVRIAGFRPGKAPLKVVQQQYGDAARAEVVADLVRETWPQAVTEAKAQPAGAPDFEITAEKPGEPLAYVAKFETYPEIVLNGLDQLKISKPVVEITDADVERLIDNLRKARRTWSAAARAAATGDQVLIDFTGRLDGEEFQGGKGEKVELELGAGQFLPDLENAIVGHAAGDTFTADVAFPEDYRAEHLRGKTAQFEVVVHEVREAVLPAIDGEFLKAHGVAEDGGEDALKAKCRTALESERDKALRARVKQQVMDQLLETHPIEVPQALVAQECARMREQVANRMSAERGGGMKPEQIAKMLPDQLFDGQARKRVALGLLIAEAIRVKDVKLDTARVDKALSDLAADYDEPEQVMQYYRSNPELLQGLRAVVLEDQLVETVAAGAVTEEAPMSLETLLKAQAQA